MSQPRVGVIGGSGLYAVKELERLEERSLTTPFGDPSDAVLIGRWQGVTAAFLPRHGRGHRIMPSHINARANIFALKSLGVEWLISVSAVGSMREDLAPGHVLIPDQFFDRTTSRPCTFFQDGIATHISFADPVCAELSAILYAAAIRAGARVHLGGTYLCIEGPQFSTKAESRIYRQWGVDVIGMTNLPEAKLAREAEMSYATLACVTDYDCWHETEEQVSVEVIVKTLQQNAAMAQRIIGEALPHIPVERGSPYRDALKGAIITDPAAIPAHTKRNLAPLIGKYMPINSSPP
ncbi:MAG: S-methyl-5'-thioadenosine phosphorylase [Nitrospinae bacterium]|nr:S-methyl-5'-thioadenosine phosphorylase [Nitrospinota bacterium]